MYILYETVARQQKVTLSVPGVAVTLHSFKSMCQFPQRYFYKHVNSL